MSILENIRMSRPEASDEEVIQALKDAQCQDIIDKFPEGIHTIIGSRVFMFQVERVKDYLLLEHF